MNPPKQIVALIAAYNAGEYLRLAVESLLNQTRPLDRIVVIDDGSTDDSMRELADFVAEGTVEISSNGRNIGRARSVNRQFDTIEADYFILLDADDLALPNRVERQLDFMEKNQRLGCSCSFIEYISRSGRRIGNGTLDLLTEDRYNDYLEGSDPFGLFCPAVIIRAEVVKNRDLQFRGDYWPADDVDLWNRIAEAGWLVLAQPEVLVRYRIHSSSAVTSSFVRTRMKFEWLRESLRARRQNQPEPTEEEFHEKWNSVSWGAGFNRARKIRAKGLYRAAGFAMAERKYISAIFTAAGAIMLQPCYAIKRIIAQTQNRHP